MNGQIYPSELSLLERVERLERHLGFGKLSYLKPNSKSINRAITTIQEVVSIICEIPIGLIVRKEFRGGEDITNARMLGIYLCVEYGIHDTHRIRIRFGRKDHTSVVYARKKVKELLGKDLKFRKLYEQCIKRLDVTLEGFIRNKVKIDYQI